MKSLSARLMALVIATSILGMGIIAAISISMGSNGILAESGGKIQAMAQSETGEVDGWIEAQKSYVGSLAVTLSELSLSDTAGLKRINENQLAAQSHFYDVYIGLPTGEAVFGTDYIPDYEQGWTSFERPWYIEAYSQPDKTVMTTPYFDSEFNKLCVTVSRAIVKDGQVLGVVAADMFTTTLEELVTRERAIEQSGAFITDSNGDILIHSDPEYAIGSDGVFKNLKEVGGGAFAGLYDATKNGGSFTAADPGGGVLRRYIAQTIGNQNWLLYVSVPTSVINAPLNALLAVVIPVSVAVIPLVAAILFFYIRRLISRPISAVAAAAKELAEGDIHVSLSTQGLVGEMATLAHTFNSMAKSIKAQADSAMLIAEGDLTASIPVRSENDAMGKALSLMLDGLNGMFMEINGATTQVAAASRLIAAGAQTLAQGSTEQAAAVEELSSSIAGIAEKTRENAAMADDAANMASSIKQSAQKGAVQMDGMMHAVQDINSASESISRVMKVIDDIAFQTNILALNAAVEAARAGTHGKGFAVVAEEVRNLAQKSAEAAKDTGALIENSMEKARLGAKIAEETARSLNEIVEGINRSSEIVGNIAQSSAEQNEAIGQINLGVDQVAQVVQQNSATAQESASASEQMSGQSEMLHGLIARFKLRAGAALEQDSIMGFAEPEHVKNTSGRFGGFSDGFGKY